MPRLTLIACLVFASACAGTPRVELAAGPAQAVAPTTIATEATVQSIEGPATTQDPAASSDAPALNSDLLAGGVDPHTLITTDDGGIAVQPTPEPLRDRRLASIDVLDPPPSDAFVSSIEPLTGEPLQRSTWNEACPVPPEDLRYVTVAFWGFDGDHHSGELIIAAAEAEAIVSVFARLHEIRFPIEQMRIVTPLDVVARRTGDGNNTASFVCRLVTGGSRFSEHAYGLAVDINPFHNPYQRDAEIIPALASSYLARDTALPGMIVPGDPLGDEVVDAFADIGWSWGGNWSSLKDYQHFAKNNR